ncbi:MAG: hypothetical protein ABI661_03930, partial [Gammaproteobacteria bacterium]
LVGAPPLLAMLEILPRLVVLLAEYSKLLLRRVTIDCADAVCKPNFQGAHAFAPLVLRVEGLFWQAIRALPPLSVCLIEHSQGETFS